MKEFKSGKIDLSGDAAVPEAKLGVKAGSPQVDGFYENKAGEERRKKKEKEERLAKFLEKKTALDARLRSGMISDRTYEEELAALKKEFADVLGNIIT
jgi:hypothetical protein